MLVRARDGAEGGVDSGDMMAAGTQRRNDLGGTGDRDIAFCTFATEEN